MSCCLQLPSLSPLCSCVMPRLSCVCASLSPLVLPFPLLPFLPSAAATLCSAVLPVPAACAASLLSSAAVVLFLPVRRLRPCLPSIPGPRALFVRTAQVPASRPPAPLSGPRSRVCSVLPCVARLPRTVAVALVFSRLARCRSAAPIALPSTAQSSCNCPSCPSSTPAALRCTPRVCSPRCPPSHLTSSGTVPIAPRTTLPGGVRASGSAWPSAPHTQRTAPGAAAVSSAAASPTRCDAITVSL